ncbi:uncharacterized protein LOC127277396 [Leptopilina boulardi]|uniref:uncharacterized protein LOC127277396 n=1 Tax=Leptopilina boulardi TaxID=63433 RepID=UPI0021F5C1C7|nr:uncharacterized protein LOC127277396 [Leptopilina boulardi]
MHRIFVFIFAISFVIVSILSEKIELYTDKYDHINVDEILANDRIRNQYYRCFLGTAPCFTPDAKFLKEKFPEALVTKCRKCTEAQKIGFEKLVLYYTEKEPEAWNIVLRKAVDDYRSSKKTTKKYKYDDIKNNFHNIELSSLLEMARFFIFAILSICITINYVIALDLYTDKYDNINIEDILNNPRIRKQYSMCYLGTGSCLTADSKFFKEIFSDAIATRCKRCTEKQKEIFEKIVVFYMKEEPVAWRMILEKILKGHN